MDLSSFSFDGFGSLKKYILDNQAFQNSNTIAIICKKNKTKQKTFKIIKTCKDLYWFFFILYNQLSFHITSVVLKSAYKLIASAAAYFFSPWEWINYASAENSYSINVLQIFLYIFFRLLFFFISTNTKSIFFILFISILFLKKSNFYL